MVFASIFVIWSYDECVACENYYFNELAPAPTSTDEERKKNNNKKKTDTMAISWASFSYCHSSIFMCSILNKLRDWLLLILLQGTLARCYETNIHPVHYIYINHLAFYSLNKYVAFASKKGSAISSFLRVIYLLMRYLGTMHLKAFTMDEKEYACVWARAQRF